MPYDGWKDLAKGQWTLLTSNDCTKVTLQAFGYNIQIKGTVNTTPPLADDAAFTVERGEAISVTLADISEGIVPVRLFARSDEAQRIYVTHD